MSKLSIIVPVYYNEDTLELLYEDLKKKVLGKLDEYEIVFVDDGSGDNSFQVMNSLRERDSHIKCVKLSRNFGEHAALLAGLSSCTGDCAVTKQADLQEDSGIILEMYESWKRGNKVVLAVRKERKENPIKVFCANLYYSLIRKMVNKNMPSGGCDCYLVDRKVIQVLELLDEKNSSLTLQVLWAGFRTDKIYFVRQEREIGKSRWTLSKKIKLVFDSVMSFSYFPLRFMSGLGIVFNILALILLISVFVEKATIGTPIAGWASLMCVILCASGLIMLMLGILGEYIWRTLDAARTRPPFIIDEILESREEKENHAKE
ncbi:MAG: glycosyltransferase family 2 protein [Lachnoclostridium sp.]|nr:glycosyltransferase family 2 protein [Lachnospira sp.]MCM1249356.1 glycosyltransferase family 2 protein [Lachnoclostridium sp.]MCM1535296.1 glycosyltransferase family 2 protein [Clostridium sp.]